MSRPHAITLSLSLAASVTAATARAEQPPSSAQAAYEEGARFFDLGDYPHAIDRFERAYTLSGAPGLLLNIAQAYRLEEPPSCEKAQQFYERFLQKSPSTPRRAEVEARVAEMRACASRPAAPSQPLAAASPLAPAPASAPASRSASPPAAAAAAPAAAPSTSPARASSRGTWLTVGWVGIAVGVVGAGAAGVSGGVALGRESSLASACAPDGGCPPSEASHVKQYDTMRAVAIVSAVVAAAGVGVAAFSFWRASLEPTVGRDAAGLAVRGSF